MADQPKITVTPERVTIDPVADPEAVEVSILRGNQYKPAEELGYEREETEGPTAVWVQAGEFTPTAGETMYMRLSVGDDEQTFKAEVIDEEPGGNGAREPHELAAESSTPQPRCDPVEWYPSTCGAVVVFPEDAKICRIDPGDTGWETRRLALRVFEVLAPPGDAGGTGTVIAEYRCGGEDRDAELELSIEGGPEAPGRCAPIETVATSHGALIVFPPDAEACSVEAQQAGWEAEELSSRIFEVSVTPGEPGGHGTVLAKYVCDGESYSGPIDLRIDGAPVPTGRCSPVETVATACGALVIFPDDASDTDVVAAGACTLEELRFEVNRLSDRVIEVVPGAPGTTGLDVRVRYRCGGDDYDEPERLEFGAGMHAAPDPLLQHVLSHPIRVTGGQLLTANGGAPGGVPALGTWTQHTIKALFPALPQQFSPGQFAQHVQTLAQPSAQPSPFGGTAVAAVTGGPTASSGGGGSPPAGGGGSGWSGPSTPVYAGAGMLPAAGGPGYGPAAPAAPAATAGGQSPGPFANQASIAAALEQNALPALDAVMPVTNDADLDEVEAQRRIIRDALTTLIGELRRNSADGPDGVIVADAIGRAQAALPNFQNALEMVPGASVSNEDFANERRFELLQTWIAMAAAVPAGGPDPRAPIGRLKQRLQIAADSARDLEHELDNFGLAANERGRVDVTPAPPPPQTPMRLSRLFEWITEEAGRQMPSLLDVAARNAGPSIVATLTQQIRYVTALTQFTNDPWTHPIVAGAVRELETQLNAALTEAQNL